MTREAFERLVEEGIERIPEEFRRYLDDVAVIVSDQPNSTQRRSARLRRDDLLFGLYEGIPRTGRQYLTYRLPDTITIFQESFERMYGDDAERIREEVAETVWHELAHALGMSEKHVRDAEKRRRNKK